MRTLFYLTIVVFCLSCSKPKQYKCKNNCITITIDGQLLDKNNATASKVTPYKIMFLNQTSSWIDFMPDAELIVKEGNTDAGGLLKTSIKIDSEELKGDKAIYIRYFPTEQYHFCENPPLHAIYSVPVNNYDQHSLSVYEKKKITMHLQKTNLDTFDKKELLFGAATDCTNGFFSSNSIIINPTETKGDYPIYGLLNRMNIITIKKTKIGSPNMYEWITDSFYVDATTVDYSMNY